MGTPSLEHLSKEDWENVYEPSDDTFIFLDALEKEQQYLLLKNPKIVLEIGSGSGCIISFVAKMLGPSRMYIATDINIRAAQATSRTAQQNKVNIHVIRTNFADAIHSKLRGHIELAVFNPPYVPTEADELGKTDIMASWAGGLDGREVIDQFIPVISDLMAEGGCFYIHLIAENKPKQVIKLMEQHHFKSEGLILKRRAANELLHIYKFIKLKTQ
uniref:Methyltransferase small domain-containing protein n=1 Tax=Arcella intermedia TaxID=1963864 RepID=A0A6B2LHP5_9EUKA